MVTDIIICSGWGYGVPIMLLLSHLRGTRFGKSAEIMDRHCHCAGCQMIPSCIGWGPTWFCLFLLHDDFSDHCALCNEYFNTSPPTSPLNDAQWKPSFCVMPCSMTMTPIWYLTQLILSSPLSNPASFCAQVFQWFIMESKLPANTPTSPHPHHELWSLFYS